MNLLVTGAAGFIGSRYVRALLASDSPDAPRVTVLDKLTYAGTLDNLELGHPRLEFVQGDICDAELVDKLMAEADQVVHFAAESHVDRSIAGAADFVRTNVLGTQTLLDAALRYGVGPFVHISTDEVYGPSSDGAFAEEDKPPGDTQATSPYARSKAMADDLAREFRGDMEVVILRPTNCFGPWQYPEKAFPRWVARALTGRPLLVWGDGLYVRQWLYAEDLSEAVHLVLTSPDVEAVYNVGPRHTPEISNLDVARWILAYFDLPEDRLVLTDYDRPQHDRRYAVDPSRIEGLGWKPGDVWEQFAGTIEWYRRSRDWWEPLLPEAESIYEDEESPA
jgi:dTDP-glucose 4,6-dehydratase